MTITYSGYGIPTPDFTDLNRTAHRIRYKHNIYLNLIVRQTCEILTVESCSKIFGAKIETNVKTIFFGAKCILVLKLMMQCATLARNKFIYFLTVFRLEKKWKQVQWPTINLIYYLLNFYCIESDPGTFILKLFAQITEWVNKINVMNRALSFQKMFNNGFLRWNSNCKHSLKPNN
jgi:hypothetical protein